jgi:hypothetical protein
MSWFVEADAEHADRLAPQTAPGSWAFSVRHEPVLRFAYR